MYGYAIDSALWQQVVYGIWEEKVKNNVLFLNPLAQAKHATFMAGGQSDVEYVAPYSCLDARARACVCVCAPRVRASVLLFI